MNPQALPNNQTTQILKVTVKDGLQIPYVDKDGFVLTHKFVGFNHDMSPKPFDEVPNTPHYQRLLKRGEITLYSET